MKQTALYQKHLDLNASLTAYAGWEMPLQYSGIISEHLAVRKSAGLFDVSHMGELMIAGPAAEIFLQYLLTRDIQKLKTGRVTYTLMCNEQGGVLDDLLVYRLRDEAFMLVVNAANTEKVSTWIKTHLESNKWHTMLPSGVGPEVSFQDESSSYALLALQGPKAQDILMSLSAADLSELKPFHFILDDSLTADPVLVSRTGYTGEDGFELYCNAKQAASLWEKLLAEGQAYGLKPAGLGARDTLRLEAGLPLYGHELDERTTPLEAGLDLFVKLDKPFFIGRDAIMMKAGQQSSRTLVAFKLRKRAVARQGCPVYIRERQVGYVTSGGYAPFLQASIGLALISRESPRPGKGQSESPFQHADHADSGQTNGLQVLTVEIRGKKVEADLTSIPFYSRRKLTK